MTAPARITQADMERATKAVKAAGHERARDVQPFRKFFNPSGRGSNAARRTEMKKLIPIIALALCASMATPAQAAGWTLPSWLTGGPPPPGYCVGYTYGIPFLVKC